MKCLRAARSWGAAGVAAQAVGKRYIARNHILVQQASQQASVHGNWCGAHVKCTIPFMMRSEHSHVSTVTCDACQQCAALRWDMGTKSGTLRCPAQTARWIRCLEVPLSQLGHPLPLEAVCAPPSHLGESHRISTHPTPVPRHLISSTPSIPIHPIVSHLIPSRPLGSHTIRPPRPPSHPIPSLISSHLVSFASIEQ